MKLTLERPELLSVLMTLVDEIEHCKVTTQLGYSTCDEIFLYSFPADSEALKSAQAVIRKWNGVE